jgi:mRNA interferase MazF
VLTRDRAIVAHRRTTVAPCTTTIRGLPSEVVLDPTEDPVPRLSAVNLDSVQNVPVEALVERIGRLDAGRMDEICAALAVAVDCRR